MFSTYNIISNRKINKIYLFIYLCEQIKKLFLYFIITIKLNELQKYIEFYFDSFQRDQRS